MAAVKSRSQQLADRVAGLVRAILAPIKREPLAQRTKVMRAETVQTSVAATVQLVAVVARLPSAGQVAAQRVAALAALV